MKTVGQELDKWLWDAIDKAHNLAETSYIIFNTAMIIVCSAPINLRQIKPIQTKDKEELLILPPKYKCKFCHSELEGTEGWEWVRCKAQCYRHKNRWARLEEECWDDTEQHNSQRR